MREKNKRNIHEGARGVYVEIESKNQSILPMPDLPPGSSPPPPIAGGDGGGGGGRDGHCRNWLWQTLT